jgi:hypothetical protein
MVLRYENNALRKTVDSVVHLELLHLSEDITIGNSVSIVMDMALARNSYEYRIVYYSTSTVCGLNSEPAREPPI